MKKTLSILTGFLLILLLAACNQTAEPVNEKETLEDSDLTLSEVLEKSTAASAELKNFAAKMEIEQEMSGAETMTIKSSIDMKASQNPIAFYQKMNMELPGSTESFETEMYFTEEGIYMFEPMDGGWMKFPTEMADMIMQTTAQQPNPAEELERLKKFMDDFTFEQDEKFFILKLSASGDKFKELIDETLQETLPELTGDMNTALDMNINSVEYEIWVYKDTFFPGKMNISMDMDMSAEGETVNVKQRMNGEYTDHNKVGEITIPQEILDSALDMGM